MEPIEIKSTNEFHPSDVVENPTPLPLDENGNVIVTDVEFPMPTVKTQHYDGTETDPVTDPPVEDDRDVEAEHKTVKHAAKK